MSVWYLDLDDEITDAVARLRAAQDDRVVLVLPPGSRIGTGRINFRLLAREAETRHLSIALVSGDQQVRAMATAAGLPAFTSVSLAEAALDPAMQAAARAAAEEAGEAAAAAIAEGGIAVAGPALISTAPGPGAGAGSARPPGFTARLRGRGRAAGAPSKTYAMTPRAASAALTGDGAVSADTGAFAREPARSRSGVTRRRRAAGWGVRLAALGGLVVAGSYVAYLVLPNATITLTPFTQVLGPLDLPITASRDVGVADASRREVPAETIPIPLDVMHAYPATGDFFDEQAATGTVTFTSANTVTEVLIPQGTHLVTGSGVEFKTVVEVIVPQANIDSGRSSAEVGIQAVKPGREGNVDAGKITIIVSGTIEGLLVKGGGVNNPKPTTGGRRDKLPQVTKDDYAAARNDLLARLRAQRDTALADPLTVPRGLTIYPATADLPAPQYTPRWEDLAGQHDETFDLSASVTASVLAVDEGLVKSTAGEALALTASPLTQVFLEAAQADVSTGVVTEDGTIVYHVSVQAPSYKALDPAELKESVKGKTVLEATSILGDSGTAQVSVWPDFLPNLPDDVRRIDLTIKDPKVTPP